MAKDVDFICPGCKETVLEEVMDDVTVYSKMDNLQMTNDTVDYCYNEQDNEGGRVVRIQCRNCGFVLMTNGDNVTDQQGLKLWFDENGRNS